MLNSQGKVSTVDTKNTCAQSENSSSGDASYS